MWTIAGQRPLLNLFGDGSVALEGVGGALRIRGNVGLGLLGGGFGKICRENWKLYLEFKRRLCG